MVEAFLGEERRMAAHRVLAALAALVGFLVLATSAASVQVAQLF
jgi:hypothetical protein